MDTKCPTCECETFIQKQVWKTGVRIVDGKAMYHRNLVTPRATAFICENCQDLIPDSVAKLVVPLAEDHQLAN